MRPQRAAGIGRPEVPAAINALGERICLGCGVHIGPTKWSGKAWACGATCRARVNNHGGPLTWEYVDEVVAEVDERIRANPL